MLLLVLLVAQANLMVPKIVILLMVLASIDLGLRTLLVSSLLKAVLPLSRKWLPLLHRRRHSIHSAAATAL